VPDYPVTISDADVKSGNDPQLTKALQVVQAEISGAPLPATSTAMIAVTSSSATSSAK